MESEDRIIMIITHTVIAMNSGRATGQIGLQIKAITKEIWINNKEDDSRSSDILSVIKTGVHRIPGFWSEISSEDPEQVAQRGAC